MDLYSKRKRAAENPPTAYRYDLPLEFRNQVWHIWQDAIGFVKNIPRITTYNYGYGGEDIQQTCALYEKMNKVLCEAHGARELTGKNPCAALYQFFETANTDQALDVIEVSFQGIFAGQSSREFMISVKPTLVAEEAVNKLNRRFQEHSIGFRLEHGQILRIDSDFLHQESTEPALRLMHSAGYAGALQEFLLAHKHYLQGSDYYDDCLTNCLKGLESTLQKIIELRNWDMPGEAKFDNLFLEVKKRGLFPAFLGTHLGELKKFLQAVAVIRNMEGAHGAGSVPNEVPEHLAAYQIHLTGSAIVFLIRCNEELDKGKK